ncbi:hypothetical protein [Chitinimonas sp.]|uniref:hypothetical protein n=1 Tax=Chitinimonas sp. TaxID=1934313 RepID=UPI002F93929F
MTRQQTTTRIATPLLLGLVLSLGAGQPTLADTATRPSAGLDSSRYKSNPIFVFFENYILDVIGQLPPEKSKAIQGMNLQKVFKTKASEWHQVMHETLGLSGTIDIAILDLWYRNKEALAAKGTDYAPQQFAVEFTDAYLKPGSQVDVWPPGALDAAKQRIAAYRAAH